MVEGQLTIIGTSHIARESVVQVKEVIENLQPSFVAVELDEARARSLLNKKSAGSFLWRDIKKIGLKGFLFSLIGAYVEKKLGERVGSAPGSEMKAAIFAARKIGAQVVLIDQDIQTTLRRFSQRLSWKEKWRLLVDVVKGLFGFGQTFSFDLSRVPAKDVMKRLIAEVKSRYPNMYGVLVVERNVVMAKNLVRVLRHAPNARIVAVVGAGHEEEIKKLVHKFSEPEKSLKNYRIS